MKRKPLLSVVREFLGALPHIIRQRPMQLMFTGIGVIAVSLPIWDYYNMPQWTILIPALIGLGLVVLGVLDLPEHEIETEHIKEEVVQDFKDIKKELKEIRERLEKIEGGL